MLLLEKSPVDIFFKSYQNIHKMQVPVYAINFFRTLWERLNLVNLSINLKLFIPRRS